MDFLKFKGIAERECSANETDRNKIEINSHVYFPKNFNKTNSGVYFRTKDRTLLVHARFYEGSDYSSLLPSTLQELKNLQAHTHSELSVYWDANRFTEETNLGTFSNLQIFGSAYSVNHQALSKWEKPSNHIKIIKSHFATITSANNSFLIELGGNFQNHYDMVMDKFNCDRVEVHLGSADILKLLNSKKLLSNHKERLELIIEEQGKSVSSMGFGFNGITFSLPISSIKEYEKIVGKLPYKSARSEGLDKSQIIGLKSKINDNLDDAKKLIRFLSDLNLGYKVGQEPTNDQTSVLINVKLKRLGHAESFSLADHFDIRDMARESLLKLDLKEADKKSIDKYQIIMREYGMFATEYLDNDSQLAKKSLEFIANVYKNNPEVLIKFMKNKYKNQQVEFKVNAYMKGSDILGSVILPTRGKLKCINVFSPRHSFAEGEEIRFEVNDDGSGALDARTEIKLRPNLLAIQSSLYEKLGLNFSVD